MSGNRSLPARIHGGRSRANPGSGQGGYATWVVTTEVTPKPMTHSEAINIYRAITGACREGIRQWMNGKDLPDQSLSGKSLT